MENPKSSYLKFIYELMIFRICPEYYELIYNNAK